MNCILLFSNIFYFFEKLKKMALPNETSSVAAMTTMTTLLEKTNDSENKTNQTGDPNYEFNPFLKYNQKSDIILLLYYGPLNPYFKIIHYSALASLAVSLVFSVYTVIYQVRHNAGNFYKWKKGKFLISIFTLCFWLTKTSVRNGNTMYGR